MALLVPDDLWLVIGLLLPPERAKPKGGRLRALGRAALARVLFVLRAGIQWRKASAELGCCGKTCWRRLGAWHAAGVWTRLHRALLERLHDAGASDWSRAALNSAGVATEKGRAEVGPTRQTAAGPAPSAALSQTPAARCSAAR